MAETPGRVSQSQQKFPVSPSGRANGRHEPLALGGKPQSQEDWDDEDLWNMPMSQKPSDQADGRIDMAASPRFGEGATSFSDARSTGGVERSDTSGVSPGNAVEIRIRRASLPSHLSMGPPGVRLPGSSAAGNHDTESLAGRIPPIDVRPDHAFSRWEALPMDVDQIREEDSESQRETNFTEIFIK